MKRMLAIAILTSLFSCGNGGKSGDTSGDSAQTEIGGVENVNGNIPDTLSTGATPQSGDNATRIDSTYADTAKKLNP
jgi:hypothetical protein